MNEQAPTTTEKAKKAITSHSNRNKMKLTGVIAAFMLLIPVYDAVEERWDRYVKRKQLDTKVIKSILDPALSEARADMLRMHQESKHYHDTDIDSRKRIRDAELNATFGAIRSDLHRLDAKMDQVLMNLPRR